MVDTERQTEETGRTVSAFYERYWEREGGSPAERVVALEGRKTLLRKAFSDLPVGAQVLDAGCGNGEFLLFLSELGYKVSGFELSPAATLKARAIVPDARLATGSLERGMPFAPGFFAAVWCSEVLEHLFDVHTAMSELNRVLVPGGLLALTVPYHGLIKNVMIALAGFERHYNPYLSHVRFFTRKTLGICLANSGFSVCSWDGVGRHWPVWMSQFVVARKTSEPIPPPKVIG
jgi:2-polyprenyl-6-hydroxyphenyl methylase/3-demethylubiquinone-9 3-methyltransferase